MTNEKWVVEGFAFQTKEEYEIAAKEQESITYIKSKSDLKNGKAALKLYVSFVEKDVFKTVVGYTFMENLRRHIINQKVVPADMIPAVPVKKEIVKEVKAAGKKDSVSALEKKCKELEHKRSISMYLNMFLAIIVVAMFAITYFSPKNNADVAREKIQNEYSEWQKQLDEKEKALEKKEASLQK